jgi:Epoxide hydrolase N terminus
MSHSILAVQDAALDDLRARLQNTRWPSVVAGRGWERGTDLDHLRDLVDYWRSSFDWREPEGFARELTALARDVVPETSHG